MMDNAARDGDIVVFGALRSGTTLLRLIINAHPQLHCPGEIDYIFEFIRRDPATGNWLIDLPKLQIDRVFRSDNLRLPTSDDAQEAIRDLLNQLRSRDNGRLVIVIHRNLAHAMRFLEHPQFVHLLRDPRDVAASSIGMGWAGNVYFGADHWIRTEQEWETYASRLDNKQVHTLRFEELIGDPPSVLASLCHYLGTEFTPQMLDYHKTSSYEPIDPGLSSQWKVKRTPREIALIELRVGDLLTRRGFQSSEIQPIRLGPFSRWQLWSQNKIYVWRERVRKFGFVDSLSLAVARRLSLEQLATAAQLRVNERAKRYLK